MVLNFTENHIHKWSIKFLKKIFSTCSHSSNLLFVDWQNGSHKTIRIVWCIIYHSNVWKKYKLHTTLRMHQRLSDFKLSFPPSFFFIRDTNVIVNIFWNPNEFTILLPFITTSVKNLLKRYFHFNVKLSKIIFPTSNFVYFFPRSLHLALS